MKTDRELLELAAKAYFAQEVADGVCSFRWDEKEESIVYIHGDNQDYNGNDVEFLWGPMAFGEDALKLAVYLKITIGRYSDSDREMTTAVYDPGFNKPYAEFTEWHDESEPVLATCRAVVRAAAAIGEAMQ